MRMLTIVTIVTIALALLVAGALPAAAQLHVFAGSSLPAYAYPYPISSYPAYAYPRRVPGFDYETVPPPCWERGHWEWERDASGRRYRVWVPSHLR